MKPGADVIGKMALRNWYKFHLGYVPAGFRLKPDTDDLFKKDMIIMDDVIDCVETLNKKEIPDMDYEFMYKPYGLATLSAPCKAMPCKPASCGSTVPPCCPNIPVQRKNTMYTTAMTVSASTPLPTDQIQREYLLDRLSSTNDDFYSPLRKKFFMDEDPAPKTKKEMADRLAAGLYIIPGLDKNPDSRINPYYFGEAVEWRDPSKPADEKGYDAAVAEQDKVYQTARDSIVINDPATGLKTLQDFAAWQPTGAAN